MKKRILITGAAGFIGSWVTRKLLGNNILVVISPFSKSKRLTDLNKKIKIVRADLSKNTQVEKIFSDFKPEYVLHLATHGVYQYQQIDEERIVKDNYLMTLNLLSASVKYHIKKFINTGSVFEYGSRAGRVKEEDVDITDILNTYSAVKMATTALASSYADKLKIVTIRPFTTYGPTEDATRFIAATIGRAHNGEPIRIAGKIVRDFVYVEDVAEAYVAAINKDFASGIVLNIAAGKKITLGEASLIIKRLLKSKSEIILDKNYIREKESHCWADISKAKKVLNWAPKYSLERGLKKTVDYFKK